MANQFLALSLFIMLLAFFIILNSISDFEDLKSRPVMNSISLAFSSKPSQETLAPNYIEDPSEAFKEGDTLDHLEALFNGQIAGIEAKKNRLGTTMHVRVPLKKFEKSLMQSASAQLRDQPFGGVGGEFLSTLVTLLLSEDSIPYRMDMILNIPENPSNAMNEKPEVVKENAKKVSLFARRLEDVGLPKTLVTAGLGQGEEETIDLYFHRHEPFNPLPDQNQQGTP